MRIADRTCDLLGADHQSHEASEDSESARDSSLIRAVAAGSHDALATLYRRYAPGCLGAAYRVCRSKPMADDIVQEVFIAMLRSARLYDRARGTVRAWIFAQVHDRAVDAIRRDRSQQARLRTVEAAPCDEDDVVEEDWIAYRRRLVVQSLEALPAAQREILELAYYSGRTQAEIAEALSLPIGTVKSRTSSAMRRLRVSLTPIRYA